MKVYSAKDVEKLETLDNMEPFRVNLPDSFFGYLKMCMTHYYLGQPFKQGLQVLVLVLALGFGVFAGHWCAFFLFLAATLYWTGRVIYAYHKCYKALGNDAFYRADKFGMSLLVDVDGMNVRYDTDYWSLVTKVYDYDNFVVIESDRKSQVAEEFFIPCDNKVQVLNSVLGYWQAALKGIRPEQMPDYYPVSEIEEIQDYVESQFGEIDSIGHEKNSDKIHLDVIVVKPSEGKPYYTICTMGAGAYRMTLDKEERIENYCPEYYEYVIYLPASWPVGGEDFKQEKNWWPVRLLKVIAGGPSLTGDKYLVCETVSYESDGNPDIKSSSVLLDYPLPDMSGDTMFTTSTGRSISFIQIVPLSDEECANLEGKPYADKSLAVYGIDADTVADMDEDERVTLFTKKVLEHFNCLCGLNSDEVTMFSDINSSSH